MLYDRQKLRLTGQIRLMPIPDILKMCEYRQGQDPRDRVFGILALGNWRLSISLCKGGNHVHVGDTIRPDYGITAFSLAITLLPGSQDNPQMNRLVMGMSGLDYTHDIVRECLKRRYQKLPWFGRVAMMPPRGISND